MEYPKFSFRRAPEIATRLEEEATNLELTTSELVHEIVTTSALTALVALVVAVMLLRAYFFRLAFLADFLSRSDLIGLLTESACKSENSPASWGLRNKEGVRSNS